MNAPDDNPYLQDLQDLAREAEALKAASAAQALHLLADDPAMHLRVRAHVAQAFGCLSGEHLAPLTDAEWRSVRAATRAAEIGTATVSRIARTAARTFTSHWST